MNLTTRYLGFKLRTPLVPSASPLSEKIDNIKRMEDAGAAAVVFHSLFEEQIRRDHHDLEFYLEQGTEVLCGIADLFSCSARVQGWAGSVSRAHCPGESGGRYSDHRQPQRHTFGGWMAYARQIEEAGADALELNIYSIPSDPDIRGEDIEAHYLTILAAIKAQLKIPVAVKLSPFFTNFARFARRADRERR